MKERKMETQHVLPTVDYVTLCTTAGAEADLFRDQSEQEEKTGEERIMGRYSPARAETCVFHCSYMN